MASGLNDNFVWYYSVLHDLKPRIRSDVQHIKRSKGEKVRPNFFLAMRVTNKEVWQTVQLLHDHVSAIFFLASLV
jgi:hypothetical protein